MNVTKGIIHRNIEELRILWDNSNRNPRKQFFYAKLALLELCGWIEETMDEIVINYIDKNITTIATQTKLKNRLDGIFSFAYDKFRSILIDSFTDSLLEQYNTRLTSNWSCKFLNATHSITDENEKRKIIKNIVNRHITNIENELNISGKFSILTSTLSTLKNARDTFAHTHTKKGVIPTYDSPMVVKTYFDNVYDCLYEFEKILNKRKIR